MFMMVVAAITATTLHAQQELTWSVDFNTIFENREGDNYYSPDQSIFLTRLSPELGVAMLGGKRNVAGGASCNVTFNGRCNPRGALLVGGRVQLNHLAKTRTNTEGQGVNDDITVNPYIGLNLSRRSALDSLELKAGPIFMIERDRLYDASWRTPCGVLVDAVAEWKWLGVKETFFAGKNLYPLYPRYGTLLNMGDPNYQAKLYSRTNVYAYIFRNQFVNLEASLDFH